MLKTINLNLLYFIDFNSEKATENYIDYTGTKFNKKRSASISDQITATIKFLINVNTNQLNYYNVEEEDNLKYFISDCIDLLSNVTNGGYTIEELKNENFLMFDPSWFSKDPSAISKEEQAIISKIQLPDKIDDMLEIFSNIPVYPNNVNFNITEEKDEFKIKRRRLSPS